MWLSGGHTIFIVCSQSNIERPTFLCILMFGSCVNSDLFNYRKLMFKTITLPGTFGTANVFKIQ